MHHFDTPSFFYKEEIGLFPFDYFIVPIVKCFMLIIRTLTMLSALI